MSGVERLRRVSSALNEQHDLTEFDSGQPELDSWLQRHALAVQRGRYGRTFLWQLPDYDNKVVGYYTLAAHEVVKDSLPVRLSRGRPDRIPAILLARLALDRRWQGRGLGGELLHDALKRAVHASIQIGVAMVVVDAIDEQAADFYAHYRFRRVPDGLRLARKMSDIVSTFADITETR